MPQCTIVCHHCVRRQYIILWCPPSSSSCSTRSARYCVRFSNINSANRCRTCWPSSSSRARVRIFLCSIEFVWVPRATCARCMQFICIFKCVCCVGLINTYIKLFLHISYTKPPGQPGTNMKMNRIENGVQLNKTRCQKKNNQTTRNKAPVLRPEHQESTHESLQPIVGQPYRRFVQRATAAGCTTAARRCCSIRYQGRHFRCRAVRCVRCARRRRRRCGRLCR